LKILGLKRRILISVLSQSRHEIPLLISAALRRDFRLDVPFCQYFDEVPRDTGKRSDFSTRIVAAMTDTKIKPRSKEDLVAVSGQKSPGDTVGLPSERKFEYEPQGFEPRNDHSELKLLEKIAETIDKSIESTGIIPDVSIKLFTEREPCPSCEDIIKQFRERYDNKISVEVEYGRNR
jgi:The  BURPS668_1122 family of deaminases